MTKTIYCHKYLNYKIVKKNDLVHFCLQYLPGKEKDRPELWKVMKVPLILKKYFKICEFAYQPMLEWTPQPKFVCHTFANKFKGISSLERRLPILSMFTIFWTVCSALSQKRKHNSKLDIPLIKLMKPKLDCPLQKQRRGKQIINKVNSSAHHK